MAQNKPKKLGTWTHEKSGISIDYFINGTRFECMCLEERMHAPEASVLRAQVMDRLEHWITMEWFPILHVEVSGESDHSFRDEAEGESVELKAKRFYLSRTPAGRLMAVGWDVDEEHRKAKMDNYSRNDLNLQRLPLKAPFKTTHRYGGDGEYLIDYTDELWATVQAMIKSLSELRTQVAKLFKNREGIARLNEAGPKLLAASTSAPLKEIGPAKKGGGK